MADNRASQLESLTRFFEREVAQQGGVRFYALLDGARSERLAPLLAKAKERMVCLLPGEVAEVVRQVAPYMTEFLPVSPLAQAFLREGWHDAWGVVAASRLDFTAVRSHFRTILKVQTEDGRTRLFRFYDPRVLTAYLASCADDELHRFFGPLVSFYAPSGGESPDGVRFAFDGRKLHRHHWSGENGGITVTEMSLFRRAPQ